MSANLLAGYAPHLINNTTKYTGTQVTPETDLFLATAYSTANSHADVITHYASEGNFPTLPKLTTNQTVTMSFGVKAASSTSFSADKLHAWVMYTDSAGNKNWIGSPVQSETISQSGWTRIAGTVVVPSGMTIAGCGVAKNSGAAAFITTDVTLSYGSGVPVAEEMHTVYATSAALSLADDAIKAEVKERTDWGTGMASRVSTLEQTSKGFQSTISSHTQTLAQQSSKISQLADVTGDVQSYMSFADPTGGKPQLTIGTSASTLKTVITNQDFDIQRSGTNVFAINGARSAVQAQKVAVGSYEWQATNGGANMTLVYIGG